MRRLVTTLWICLLLGLSMMIHASDPETVWIDVRTAEEFSEGHLEGAHNIPHDQIVTGISDLGIAKDQPIVVYCRSGRRAQQALELLNGQGYSEVFNAIDLDGARALKNTPADGKQPE